MGATKSLLASVLVSALARAHITNALLASVLTSALARTRITNVLLTSVLASALARTHITPRYVPYSVHNFSGYWGNHVRVHAEDAARIGDHNKDGRKRAPNDLELYDYNIDPHETSNLASNSKYAKIVERLRLVLRMQFAPTR